MDKEIKQLVENEKNQTKRLRALLNAKYASYLVVEDGKIVSVKASASEIKELIEAEDQLMKMERRTAGLPKELQ